MPAASATATAPWSTRSRLSGTRPAGLSLTDRVMPLPAQSVLPIAFPYLVLYRDVLSTARPVVPDGPGRSGHDSSTAACGTERRGGPAGGGQHDAGDRAGRVRVGRRPAVRADR